MSSSSRSLPSTLLLAALLPLAAAPAQAQMPQRAQEIVDLRELVRQVEAENKVALTPLGEGAWGTIMIVERDRLNEVAVWMVQGGRIQQSEVGAWAQNQLATSRRLVTVMKEQLARLEAGEEWSPPPRDPSLPGGSSDTRVAGSVPGDVSWPTSLDGNWAQVSGTVRGSYSVQCYYDNRRVPAIQGTFRLDLPGRGSGQVLGSYTHDGQVRQADGEIRNDGQAGGRGQASDATIVWAVQFAREGNRLVIRNPGLQMIPNASGARCDSGVMEQE